MRVERIAGAWKINGIYYDPESVVQMAAEIDRLRSLNAELVEALEVIIGRSRFDSEEEWMDFIDAVDEGRRILSRARAKEDT